MAKETFYVTTAIDYVNAKPHCGHAFEKTLADALARYKRLQGYDVFFLTGVDENAQKNVEAAEKAGTDVREFINKNANLFIELCKKLNLTNNDFIRTTAKEHAIVVQKIVRKMIDKKDIYKDTYEGLYCVGCETYYTEKDLIDGKCPEHNKEPELRKEDAYFFKLSKYKKELLKIIPKYVIPQSRANEVISRIENEELNNICISRKGAKWGIDFPNDKSYKIWVWIDALINYISGLKEKESKYWPADIHVIGKGINWFHSVIWPAMLLSAEYKLPKKLMVHGYLNIEGKKMSKSLGNTLDPLELLNKYPSDMIRYAFLKCSVFEDSDFSEELIVTRNNNELANKLGNLVSRVSTLASTIGLEKSKPLDSKSLIKRVSQHLDNLEFDKALNEIFAFIDLANLYIQQKKPWETKDRKVLYQLAGAIKDSAILLSPFIPETSEKIAKIFGFEISLKSLNKPLEIKPLAKAEILFKKIDLVENKTEAQVKTTDNKAVNKNINKPSKTSDSIPGVIKMDQIKFDDFAKLDLRVATIKKVEDLEGADKLYKLEIDTGKDKRTILAGIKQYYKKEELIDKQIIVIVNLEPRKMKGVESQGMLLAASNEDHSKVILIGPEKKIDSGSKVQ
jgi:methionyl-tRNA synthetase